jgi:hypothetical protein
LISLFSFSACKNAFEVGLDTDNTKPVDLRIVDTATIRTVTVREDSASVNNLTQYPFGFIDDPEIGTTRSDLVAQLSLASAGITWGANSIIDSAVLVLKYGNEFYGDETNSTYSIDVHELTEDYEAMKGYPSSKIWAYDPAVIGSITIPKFATKANVTILEPLYNRRDTVLSRGPHLRIPIDTAYIRSRFINAPDDSTYVTSDRFLNYFKGLYININRNNSTGNGGLVTFNLAGDSSQVRVYYRNITNSTVIDTLIANFNLSPSTSAASVSHTYIQDIQDQLDNPSREFSTTFVQPAGGLRTRVSFPYIDRLKSLGNILINKAELVVLAVPSSLEPANRLTLYRTDLAGQRQPVPDNNIGQKGGIIDSRYLTEADFGGFYDKTNQRYVFNITSYVQDLLDGKLTQYHTYLGALQASSLRGSGSDVVSPANTVGRAILGGGNNSQYKMKLTIIYTKVNR